METRRATRVPGKNEPKRRPRPLRPGAAGVERLEGRQLLATFSVTSLGAAGAGSLRQAIIDANQSPGADTIAFGVAGTIRLGKAALPPLTDVVTIDGGSAPGFSGTPVVTVDYRGGRGLRFAGASDGSALRSLSLVNASSAGVTLDASRIAVEGNYIGLRADGRSIAGNRGDGIRINASSDGNRIGREDPVSSITYANAGAVSIQPVTAWQGIRASDAAGQFLIVGTSGVNGLLYDGPISGVGGTSLAVNYPGATSTSVYGPDNLDGNGLRLVGSYKDGDQMVHGFLFEGTAATLDSASGYRTIDYPGAKYTYVHSTMGGLAVGNGDGPEGNAPIGTGHAFLYDVAKDTLLPDIVYPGSTSTTAYGIWHNGRTNYTIAGGYSTLGDGDRTLSRAFLVDYDSATGLYSNWTSFAYPNGLLGQDYITHFEGISGVEKGVYTLNADSVQRGTANPAQGSFVSVRRNADGTFGPSTWTDLNFPGSTGIASSNSVSGNNVVGVVFAASGNFSFQATVNVGFQLSNVISGNRGNGIGIHGSDDNRVAMNNIGTDATGTLARGNGGQGILITQGARRNLIGGQATAGNNPTAGVFARPPQGNLISGNRGNGVLLNKGATQNILSGNFVGTAASGNSALGNRLDGVAIDGADGNQLIGCTFQQDPFVFYNVLSGNGGNGLRITNSDDTTVQANFMGVGANNASVVANKRNGLLVSGTSKRTQVGGVIPLGNVISGNNQNGIEVRDKASGLVSFNTFAGIFAFGGAAPNRRNGILVTSTGGDNLIRTCIVSGNLGNGIEIGGNATGVQVTETAIGTNTSIGTAIPNRGSGIKFSGRAHDNAIGGFQPSIEPQVTISANQRYGVEVVGSARNNAIVHTFIGTNFDGTVPLGNGLGGVLLGPGTSGTTIGGPAAAFQVRIANNGGNGVTIRASRRNAVVGDLIASNQRYGVEATGNDAGTVLQGNTFSNNGLGDVNLAKSRGVANLG
ncbi:beta strand repeat-containing protein [Tundrisphaera sp. TA3]|uniref:beta strand repeat-containing protein n=1 Tax=Tundrisphaera sp. TA3 TaxID=3435775 RepID=UPI003EC008C5